jgi:hypothetical protein
MRAGLIWPAKGRTFKALSWNVNGLRALLEKQPEQLTRLVQQEAPDYLCLQVSKACLRRRGGTSRF